MIKKLGICAILLINFLWAVAQKTLPYKDSRLPIEARVNDLIKRMTPEEKFWQLFMIPGDLGKQPTDYAKGIFGFQVSASSNASAAAQLLHYGYTENAGMLARKINAIQRYFVEHTRLGIPIIAFDESLHGWVRSGSTAFPQAIGLAASWDTAMMHEVATAIAVETKARGIRQVLSPVINIASDVRWGRTEETYGEDPFLTSAMGVAYISAFERMGIVTTPKHFIANVGEGGRDSYPIHINQRQLEEVYLPPFKAAIERGGARSIMTAYNSLNGRPASANEWLLQKKLKSDWHFSGFVLSDAGAVGGANVLHFTAKDYPDASKQSMVNGLDVIFQTAYEHYRLFIPPFLNGQIPVKRIDDAVARVLRVKFQLGLFEHPYINENDADQWNEHSSHKQLARNAAGSSMVLLKNENNILPLAKNISSIALIGTDATEARLGGYSGPGNGKVNLLEGIKAKLGKGVIFNYVAGVGRQSIDHTIIPASFLSSVQNGKRVCGLSARYYNALQLSGNPVLQRTDAQIDFNWTLFSPSPQLPTDQYSVSWQGLLQSPGTGTYQIGLEGNDGFRLYINGHLLIDRWFKQSYTTQMVPFHFDKDSSYQLQVEFYESAGNAHIHLVWNVGVENNQAKQIATAVSIAKQSAVAIIVAGITEGEFQDRASLALPGDQENLILEVAKTGTPLVVLLNGGSAITMQHWIDKVQGILDIWYPGEEGGNAVAEILFGDRNPSGKLPISFPISEAQLPLVYNHLPTGRGDDYNNLSGLPLFPFGYGLSYTRFSYTDMQLQKQTIKKGESVALYCTIKNEGTREGEEVVQLYIHDQLASVARPVLALKGFQKIHLMPGEAKRIKFTITPDMLAILNDSMQTVVEPGDFRVMIGASSRELWLKANLHVSK